MQNQASGLGAAFRSDEKVVRQAFFHCAEVKAADESCVVMRNARVIEGVKRLPEGFHVHRPDASPDELHRTSCPKFGHQQHSEPVLRFSEVLEDQERERDALVGEM